MIAAILSASSGLRGCPTSSSKNSWINCLFSGIGEREGERSSDKFTLSKVHKNTCKLLHNNFYIPATLLFRPLSWISIPSKRTNDTCLLWQLNLGLAPLQALLEVLFPKIAMLADNKRHPLEGRIPMWLRPLPPNSLRVQVLIAYCHLDEQEAPLYFE